MTILTHSWNGHLISQVASNIVLSNRQVPVGYVNATQVCKSTNKLWADYKRLNRTKAFVDKLSESMGIPIDLLIVTIEDGVNENRGTWIHPDIAIDLATWVSVDFHVWAMQTLRKIINESQEQPKTESEPKSPDSQSRILSLLDVVKQSLLNCGIESPLAEGVYLNGLASHFPEIAPQVNEAHKLLAATTESDLFYSPTSLGKELGISAIKVNLLLVKLGLQIDRGKPKRGEPRYVATEKGKPYAHNSIATGRFVNGRADNTDYQHLKWKLEVIQVLRKHIAIAQA